MARVSSVHQRLSKIPLNISLLPLLLAVAFVGCTSKPVKDFGSIQEGVWRGRALIKDKAKNKTHVVEMDLVAVKPGNLRIEVTTPLGIHLARFTMNDKAVNYIITREKKFYRGEPKPGVLLPVLRIPMDPHLFMNVLFDEAPEVKGWACEREKNLLKSCDNPDLGLALEWKERRGEGRVVAIKGPDADVQMDLKDFRPNVDEKERVFHVDPPKGFRIISVE